MLLQLNRYIQVFEKNIYTFFLQNLNIYTFFLQTSMHSRNNNEMHNTFFDLKQQVLGQVTPKPTEVTRRSALHFPDLNRNLDFLPCETIKITQAKFPKYPCGGHHVQSFHADSQTGFYS